MGNNSAPLGTIIKHNEEPGLTQSTQEKGENTANISSTKETVKTYINTCSIPLSLRCLQFTEKKYRRFQIEHFKQLKVSTELLVTAKAKRDTI